MVEPKNYIDVVKDIIIEDTDISETTEDEEEDLTGTIESPKCEIEEDESPSSKDYKENVWPASPEEPKGNTLKGKTKSLAFAIDKTKSTLKKGIERELNGIKFKVLDVRKVGGATQKQLK